MTGYLMLQRRFFSHWIWEEKRSFSKAEAFLDLLQLAAFVPTKRMISGSLIELDEGEIVASVRYLSARWTWGKDKVAAFMKSLEKDAMIRRETRQGETIIILCNYKDYNSRPDSKPDSDPPTGQTVTRQRPDKVEEGEEGKEFKPTARAKRPAALDLSDFDDDEQPSFESKPLCTLKQAIEAGRIEKISDQAVAVWWDTRHSAGWTKGTAGGGVRNITDWRSDLRKSRTWAEEEALKSKVSAKTNGSNGSAVTIGGRTYKP